MKTSPLSHFLAQEHHTFWKVLNGGGLSFKGLIPKRWQNQFTGCSEMTRHFPQNTFMVQKSAANFIFCVCLEDRGFIQPVEHQRKVCLLLPHFSLITVLCAGMILIPSDYLSQVTSGFVPPSELPPGPNPLLLFHLVTQEITFTKDLAKLAATQVQNSQKYQMKRKKPSWNAMETLHFPAELIIHDLS